MPLLQGYIVDKGWITSAQFLLGFSLLQSLPGPNFGFALYLGVLAVPHSPFLGALAGYIGIFTPGILCMLAVTPYYSKLRQHVLVRKVLEGVNAAAVGLIWSAVYRLVS